MYFRKEKNSNNPVRFNRKGKLVFPLMALLIFICSGFVSYITAQTVGLTSKVALSSEYKNGIANNSTVIANPSTVAVGGTIIITATIIDEYHNPLQNHTVNLGVISVPGVSLTQLTDVTDANGQVFASLTSSVSGNFEVYAIDKTYMSSDNQEILITQNAAIAFLSNSVKQVTTTLSASVVPTSTVLTTNIVTPTVTPLPTTITPTQTVSPTPTSISITSTTQSSNNNLLLDLLGYSICGNDTLFYIILVVLLLFVGIIIRISESREEAQESIFIYLFIFIIGMFLLRFMCLPLLPVMIGYIILVLTTIKPIRQKLFNQ